MAKKKYLFTLSDEASEHLDALIESQSIRPSRSAMVEELIEREYQIDREFQNQRRTND